MSNLKRYAVSLVLLIFAALVFLVGILAVTVWKPPQHIAASGESSQPFVMTRTGVLPLYNPTVTVTVTAEDPSQKVWMAIGSSRDIKGWLGERPYDEVIGLTDITTLKFLTYGDSDGQAQSGDLPQSDAPQSDWAEPETGSAEAAQSDQSTPDVDLLPVTDPVPTDEEQSGEVGPGPIASDMWLSLREGHGTIEMELLPSYEDASLLIATDGDSPAPKLTLTWSYPQPNLLAWTSLGLATAVLLLAALTAWVTRRRQAKRKARAQQLLAASRADVTETAAIPAITDDIAKEIAEAESTRDDDVQPETVERAPVLSDERFAPEDGAESESTDEPEEAATEPEETVEAPMPTESISTDSGMINLAALQGGAAFPTRRALREAQARGVQSLVVEGREFHTGSTPVVAAKSEESDTIKEAVSRMLGKRSARAAGWNSAFTKQKRSADEASDQTAESEGEADE